MNQPGPVRKFWQRWEQLWRRRSVTGLPRPQTATETDSLALESLEDRILLAAPSPYEQYMLELVNLARRDPAAYAASLGINLNEGLPAGTLSTAARQPLAFNPDLVEAAANHSQWMLDQGQFSHSGAGGSSPSQRMTAAGYQFSGAYTWGENIAFRGTSGTINPTTYTRVSQDALFVDAGVSGRGHRINLLNDNFMEVGIGIRTGQYSGMNALMVTQDFAKTASPPFFTGVVYSDGVAADRFYTPGEGLGGITVTAVRDGGGQTYTTTTWASGGFSLGLPKGRYSFLVSGPGLSSSQFMPVVLMGTKNRKFDFLNGQIRQAPEIALSGNGYSIIHLDSTPRTADGTHFGEATVGSFVERSFTIRNHGNAPLQLSGTPRVAISGAQAADFVVTVQPSSTVEGGSSVTFTVRFSPSAGGLRNARISISSNDSNESPFQFSLAGQGLNSQTSSAFYSSFLGTASTAIAASTASPRWTAAPLQALPATWAGFFAEGETAAREAVVVSADQRAVELIDSATTAPAWSWSLASAIEFGEDLGDLSRPPRTGN